MTGNYLIVFLKYPEPGKVKTRLSKSIGSENAVELYRLFVESILEQTSDQMGNAQNKIDSCCETKKKYETLLFFTPEERKTDILTWLGNNHNIYLQKGKDLGERMSNAFKAACDLGAKSVIIIGSDTPTLEKTLILKAFELLNQNDVIIGPAKDGGYYLLGLSFITDTFTKLNAGLIFSDIEWSSSNVYSQTMAKLKQINLSCKLLPEFYDIDNFEDLYSLKQDISHMNTEESQHLRKIGDMLVRLLK